MMFYPKSSPPTRVEAPVSRCGRMRCKAIGQERDRVDSCYSLSKCLSASYYRCG